MIEGTIFVGAAIIAATEIIKQLVPKVAGWVVIIVAAVLGGIIGAVDIHIGVQDITIAQGVMLGLAAAGVHTTARQVG